MGDGVSSMKKFTLIAVFVFLVFPPMSCQAGSLAERFEGIWLGAFDHPDVTIRLAYRITVNDDGTLSVVHDSPDYGITDIPVRRAEAMQ